MTKKPQVILNQLHEAQELATELFNGIRGDALMWMQAPSEHFFGQTPIEIIYSGHGNLIIEWLMIRIGRRPGAAF